MIDDFAKTDLGFCTVYDDVPYGVARQGGKSIALHCSLYLPQDTASRPPLFVWFHGGAFKFGSYKQKMARRLGRRLSKMGIAVASVEYRLRGTAGDLSAGVAGNVDAYQRHRDKLIRPGLCEFRSLVALEDGARFLAWAQDEAPRFGWSEKRVLGGSSAGGITAFNIAFGSTPLGLPIPPVHGAFACSGGYNYPDFVNPRDDFRVLALHNPLETRVSVNGVRMLERKLGGQMELLESDEHIHGHCDLNPDEPKARTYQRIADFVGSC